jgi:hypothetical protein
MSHIDWVFCSTDFDSHYSLASARTLPRTPSDHTPILWDSGTGIGIRKPRFKLENGGSSLKNLGGWCTRYGPLHMLG